MSNYWILRVAIEASSNGISFLCKSKVEVAIMGSTLIGCMCNLLIGGKKDLRVAYTI